jgi:UDP-N-acetylglucosamine 2-epimerase
MKIISVVGARPQFIKIAPLCKEFKRFKDIKHLIIHTGQHYDYNMSKIFFDQIEIPESDYHLEVGSGAHGWQTGEMIKRAEEILLKEKPDWVLVYGDTNSTLAGALAAAKIHIPVAHIEAGLRSYNKEMPEEINRILTDHISSILFCPTEIAVNNLQKEGFGNIVNHGSLVDNSSDCLLSSAYRLPVVINVGDVMYDAMLMSLEIAEKKSNIFEALSLKAPRSSFVIDYYLATIHRAENTDNEENLKNIFKALLELSQDNPVIVPLHPRTMKIFDSLNPSFLTFSPSLRVIEPVSYFDMLILEKNAKAILTDSGGIQKEAYWFRVPCVTLRYETEWVETVEYGWNKLVGINKEKILDAVTESSLNDYRGREQNLIFGDGKASERIINIIFKILQG